jgi:GTP-binding protein
MLDAWRTIEATPMPEIVTQEPVRIELRDPDAFSIERGAQGEFVVTGDRVERLAAMTDFDSDEGMARFERVMGKMGLEKRLADLGAQPGDTVRIGAYEFTYS